MKKTITTILISLIAVNLFAAGYAKRVRYHYATTVSADVPALDTLVELRDDSDGQGVKFKWKTAYAPTKATLDALDDATVEAWVTDTDNTEDADYGKWSKREKVMLKLWVKEINLLRQFAGLPVRTAGQVKAALKAEMEN